MRTPPPPVLLLGSIFSVQFGSAFASTLFAQAGPAGVVLLRLGLSGVVLLAWRRPSLRGRSRGDVLAVIAFGLVLGGMNWTFYECIDRLPLGVAVTIELVGPLALAVAGSRRAVDALWIVLAVSGVVLLALDGNHHGVTAFGVVLALIAAVGWACYILLSKRVGRSFATLDALSIALFVGAVVVTPAGLVEGGTTLLHPAILAGGAAVAVLSSIVPFSLEIMALRRLSASTFGLLMSLEPAVAALAGLLVRGQPVTGVLVIAVVLVIVASVGTTVTARKPLEVVAAGPQ